MHSIGTHNNERRGDCKNPRVIRGIRFLYVTKGYGEKILQVGINYDKKSENKKHECVIEEWVEE